MAKKYDKVQNPFDYLMEDHERVSTLFKKLEATTENAEKTRQDIFKEINEGLTLHAELEEHTLYPLLEEIETTHELTIESEEEHEVVKNLLSELEAEDCTTEEWAAKAKVLEENVAHHVEEEEKADGLFKKAQKALSKEEIEALGEKMEEYLERGDGVSLGGS